MAVTTEKSTQVGNVDARPLTPLSPIDNHGRVRIAKFNFTQGAAPGDATSTMELVRLPGGSVRVLWNETVLHVSAFGASRTLDVGFRAHTDENGDAVVEDDNGLSDDIDVAAAGQKTVTGVLGTDEVKDFTSQDGVDLFATVAGGTIPAAATITGYVVYVKD